MKFIQEFNDIFKQTLCHSVVKKGIVKTFFNNFRTTFEFFEFLQDNFGGANKKYTLVGLFITIFFLGLLWIIIKLSKKKDKSISPLADKIITSFCFIYLPMFFLTMVIVWFIQIIHLIVFLIKYRKLAIIEVLKKE